MLRILFCFLAMSSTLFASTDYSIYLVTRQDDHSAEWLLGRVEKAVQGGVTIVELQQENMSTEEMIALGKELHALLQRYDVPLTVAKRVDVAKAIGAEGVHLFKASEVAVARRELGPDAIIGLQVKDLQQLVENEGASYFCLGPIFSSETFPRLKPYGLETLKNFLLHSPKPLTCSGGIRHHNVGEPIRAGVAGVVVISSVLFAEDPRKAAHEMWEIIQQARK